MRTSSAITRRTALLGLGAGATALAAASPLPLQPAYAGTEMKGVRRPQYYRFKLGEFEITTLLDGAIQLDGPHPIFGQNVDAAEVQALAEANFLPPQKMEISFAPFLVNTGAELVMFDSGNGLARRPNAGRLAAMLSDIGYAPGDVDIVVISHFHPDHIGGLMEDGKPLFPNARYVTAAGEYDFWSKDDRLTGPTERVATLTRANVVPLAEKITFLEGEGDVTGGIRSLAAAGHTPGHMAFHIESAGRRLVAIADTCNHYVVSLQRPDWHVRFDMDKEGAVATRKRILGMIAADKVPFTGYHMPFPAVGFLEPHGEGFRYVPVSYQLNGL